MNEANHFTTFSSSNLIACNNRFCNFDCCNLLLYIYNEENRLWFLTCLLFSSNSNEFLIAIVNMSLNVCNAHITASSGQNLYFASFSKTDLSTRSLQKKFYICNLQTLLWLILIILLILLHFLTATVVQSELESKSWVTELRKWIASIPIRLSRF